MTSYFEPEDTLAGESLLALLRRELPGFEAQHDGRGIVMVRGVLKLGAAYTIDPTELRLQGSSDAMNAALVGRFATEVRAKAIEIVNLEPTIQERERVARQRGEHEGYQRGRAAGKDEGRRELLAELARAAGWEERP